MSTRKPGPENRLAEDFLVELGVVTNRSQPRRALLGCLACRWNTNQQKTGTPTAYGYEMGACLGSEANLVYNNLNNLENAGVLASTVESPDEAEPGRPQRKYYVPADSELGVQFAELLEEPASCELPPAGKKTVSEVTEVPNNREAAAGIIASSTPEDLQWIIEQAQLRLNELAE